MYDEVSPQIRWRVVTLSILIPLVAIFSGLSLFAGYLAHLDESSAKWTLLLMGAVSVVILFTLCLVLAKQLVDPRQGRTEGHVGQAADMSKPVDRSDEWPTRRPMPHRSDE